MNAGLLAWARKRPLPVFYMLAFAITWLGWLPQAAYSRGLFPFDSPLFYVLGGAGPLLAVFIMLKILWGTVDYSEPFRPFLQWRAGFGWYLVALLGYPAMWFATLALVGGLNEQLSTLASPFSLLTSFLVAFLAAVPEEVAWRGFALPRIQARYSALISSIIVGAFWALWHLPLLLNTNNTMSTYPVHLYFLDVIGRSVIYVWIFNNTKGSLLFVTLFHAASNTVGGFAGVENLMVTYGIVAILVLLYGAKHLSRASHRPAKTDLPEPAPQAG